MGRTLRGLSDELDAPLGLVLEGGYAVDALAASVTALLPVLASPAPVRDADGPLPVHPLAAAAAERLALSAG